LRIGEKNQSRGAEEQQKKNSFPVLRQCLMGHAKSWYETGSELEDPESMKQV
jgi:hypothetical protein